MGQPYTTQIDMWSAGTTLYELATERILFQGESNNAMIHMMLKVFGPLPKNRVTFGKFAPRHFNADGDFLITGGADGAVFSTLPINTFAKPSFMILQLLEEAAAKHPEAAGRISVATKSSLRQLADLIMQCCKMDPVQRFQPTQALKHAFVQKVYDGTGEVPQEPANNVNTSKSHANTPKPAGSASMSDPVRKREKSDGAEKPADIEDEDEVVEVAQPSPPSVEARQASSASEQAPSKKEPEKAKFLMLNPENTIRFRGDKASLHMTNNSRTWVAFKFKTTNPDIYLVKPTTGVLARGARQELQLQLQSRTSVINKTHRFLVQAMEVASGGPVPRERWSEVSKSAIQEHNLGAELVQKPGSGGKTSSVSGSDSHSVRLKNLDRRVH